MTARSRKKGYTDDCRRRLGTGHAGHSLPAAWPCWSPDRGYTDDCRPPAKRAAMPVTRAMSTDHGHTDDCRRAGCARGHAGHAVLTQAESTPFYPPTLPMAPKRARLYSPRRYMPTAQARLYSPRRYMLAAQASTRAYLELTVQNVFVFHAHAFNIALLLAVDPPTAQEAETKPGA
jgi:hypothetical protein